MCTLEESEIPRGQNSAEEIPACAPRRKPIAAHLLNIRRLKAKVGWSGVYYRAKASLRCMGRRLGMSSPWRRLLGGLLAQPIDHYLPRALLRKRLDFQLEITQPHRVAHV